MGIIGIVSEYNPFHNGHHYHINESRKLLGDNSAVVCVMSGDFVQRGEASVYSKFSRAEAAVRCGSDLVIELPLAWSLSSAEGFARGAVGLLNNLGVSHISFGSECGNIEPLETVAKCLLDPSVTNDVKQLMDKEGNVSFPAARQIVLEKRLGPLAKMLELPNNILAIEYLKALHELGSEIKALTVMRYGNGHDKTGDSGPKSASELRKAIFDGNDISADIPEEAARVYLKEKERGREASNRAIIDLAMLSRLRMLDEEDFELLPDSADGLGIRLYKAVQQEVSVEAICSAAKSKRFAHARIRRMCMCACLGVTEGMNKTDVPYARVLAANERGCELLKSFRETSKIPVISKPASVRNLSLDCIKSFSLGASAHDFYTLSYSKPEQRIMGEDWRTSPIIVKNV